MIVLAAIGTGAALANASLSSTYGPEQAVVDFLAAQKRGDVGFMFANANYLRGDGSYSQYFNSDGLAAMMANPQNSDISGVNVSSVAEIDSTMSQVNVTMVWGGHQLQRAFTLHRDPSRTHYLFFSSWRIDIPFASIHVTLPNQPGGISVDGLALPADASQSSVQVIQGFHKITMEGTSLSDAASADADGIEANPNVAFSSEISATALAAAASAVSQGFQTCDPSKYTDCLNHVYRVPANTDIIHFVYVPTARCIGHCMTYEYTLATDPTADMQLVVESDAGKVGVSGVCSYTFTQFGRWHTYFTGTWRGTLTMSGGSFTADLFLDCHRSKV